MKHRYQSFTRIGRQFQSLKRQVYLDWTLVSFPHCQRSCLIWRIMTNAMTNTYVVIFLSASIFGRGYHSRYRNFEFTALDQWRLEARPGMLCTQLYIINFRAASFVFDYLSWCKNGDLFLNCFW